MAARLSDAPTAFQEALQAFAHALQEYEEAGRMNPRGPGPQHVRDLEAAAVRACDAWVDGQGPQLGSHARLLVGLYWDAAPGDGAGTAAATLAARNMLLDSQAQERKR